MTAFNYYTTIAMDAVVYITDVTGLILLTAFLLMFNCLNNGPASLLQKVFTPGQKS